MSSIFDWSTTPDDNGSSDAQMPWPEGMARKQVNNSARQLVARIAELIDDLGGGLSAGGTANGLTLTPASDVTALANGLIVSFRATADNTAAATLNYNGLGAKAIRKMDSTGDVALAAGDIQNTGIYMAQYSAVLDSAAGAWLLVNPTLSAAIYAFASSGVTLNSGDIYRTINTDFLNLNGGDADGTGANIQLAGGAHASLPNQAFHDAASHTFRTQAGAATSSTLVDIFGWLLLRDGSNRAVVAAQAAQMFFRPNGTGSTVGQMTIATDGAVVINGTLTVTG